MHAAVPGHGEHLGYGSRPEDDEDFEFDKGFR